jgi:hypothetical protein
MSMPTEGPVKVTMLPSATKRTSGGTSIEGYGLTNSFTKRRCVIAHALLKSMFATNVGQLYIWMAAERRECVHAENSRGLPRGNFKRSLA